MPNDVAAGAAAWLKSHVDIALPPDRLPSYVNATAKACAGAAAEADALAMEDEPANFIAALVRRGGA